MGNDPDSRISLAIDGVGARHGGAATVLTSIVTAALEHPGISRVHVFCSPASTRHFALPDSSSLAVHECPLPDRNLLARLLWLERGAARLAERVEADALLFLGGGGSAPKRLRSATYIQRTQPFSSQFQKSAPLLEGLRVQALRGLLARSTRHCDRVYVQTQTMRARVIEELSLSPEQVEVYEPSAALLPSGPPSPSLVSMRAAPSGRRLLYVGSAPRHKDLQTLRKALWLLRKAGVDAHLFLTLEPEHPMARGEGIHGVGYLDPASLREAYELATVVVTASREETVGLPLVEAMSFSKPVLAPDLPYAREVCAHAATFFFPGDARSAAEGLRTLLENEALRRSLGEAGQTLSAERSARRPFHRMLDSLLSIRPRAAQSRQQP